MLTLRQSIPIFVKDALKQKPFNEMIVDWRVEEAVIADIIINHFYNLGIYFVEPLQQHLILKSILHQIKYSSILQTKVKKADLAEKQERRQVS